MSIEDMGVSPEQEIHEQNPMQQLDVLLDGAVRLQEEIVGRKILQNANKAELAALEELNSAIERLASAKNTLLKEQAK